MQASSRPSSLLPRLRSTLAGCALALFVAAPATAQVPIADAPLFVTSSVEPNILFILDDSGSMHWETIPDDRMTYRYGSTIGALVMWLYPRVAGLHGGADYANTLVVGHSVRADGSAFAAASYISGLFRSWQNNPMYYNPAITYRPWVNADGSDMPAADPTAAPNRPLFPGFGTRDMTAPYTFNNWRTNAGGTSTTSMQVFPSVYYRYNGGPIDQAASYERVEIRPANGPFVGDGREARSDCVEAATATCSYAEEIQNFANWYSYHRNRVFASRAGIGRAFVQFDGGMRVGYGTINHGRTSLQTVDGVAGRTVIRGVRDFLGPARAEFFDLLYQGVIPATGTPLRRALEGAGEYFTRTDARGPWSTTPGALGGEDLSCRQSFSILMTDGYTTGGSDWQAIDASRRANTDGTTAGNTLNINPTGPNFEYVPVDPFRDAMSNNLADVAMYYWKRDLRPDLPNRVPTSDRNPAYWQHMVTYGVGLGVSGTIDPDTAFQAVRDGTPIAWPDPQWSFLNCGDSPGASACGPRIDDLLHAAINSRGGFFSVQDPDSFATELAAVLADIVARVEASATSAATSSAVLQTDTLLYTAGFRSGDWSGQLIGREVNPDGTVGVLVWDAEALLAGRAPGSRNLFTRNSSTNAMVALDFMALSPAQQAALDHAPDNSVDGRGGDRMLWLQGFEGIGGLRSRTEGASTRLLGDIINSNPQYAGKTDFGYQLLPGGEGGSYGSFRASAAYGNRPDVIYVAANSGFLHAFNAENGQELFAYMPSELLLPEPGRDHAKVSRVMDPEYLHRYLNDGTPTIRDAYINDEWRTVLVGSMGAGGRTVYALDVTNPSSPTLLWEFTHPNLGYKVAQPSIARLRDGTWAAVFGNGYNTATNTASVFLVNLATGALIQNIDTGVGSGANPNGMAGVAVTDFPFGDLQAARLYAGDLLGNVWVFDVGSPIPGDWSAPAARRILYTALDSGGVPQPITSRPALALLPGNVDTVVVSFGTGSYFRDGDATVGGAQTQTLYGIFDRGTPVAGRGELLQQTIVEQRSEVFTTPTGPREFALRLVSDNPIDITTQKGWFLDLEFGGSNQGERVISPGTFPSGRSAERIRFTTLIPDEDPCGTGRRGYLMDIDLVTGGRFIAPVFDLTGDGQLDDADLLDDLPPSGIGFGAGEIPTTIRRRDVNLEGIYTGEGENVDGRTGVIVEGRQSWRQLR